MLIALTKNYHHDDDDDDDDDNTNRAHRAIYWQVSGPGTLYAAC